MFGSIVTECYSSSLLKENVMTILSFDFIMLQKNELQHIVFQIISIFSFFFSQFFCTSSYYLTTVLVETKEISLVILHTGHVTS